MRRKEAIVQMLHVKRPSRPRRLQHPLQCDRCVFGRRSRYSPRARPTRDCPKGWPKARLQTLRAQPDRTTSSRSPTEADGWRLRRTLGREREIVRSQAFERRRAPEAAARIEQRRDTVAQRFHVSHKPKFANADRSFPRCRRTRSSWTTRSRRAPHQAPSSIPGSVGNRCDGSADA